MRWLKQLPALAVLPILAWISAAPDAAARQARPDVVKIEFPKDGYSYTLAEAAKGIKIQYKIIVEQDYEGVIPLRSAPSFREPPGPSGLHPREQVSGNDQVYCLRDFGLAAPPEEVAKTLKKGTYLHSFEWDGRNWSGPSDFGNPKGKPFPAGTYDVTVTLRGKLADKGKTPYEITRKVKLVLK
jgi:hypothetical protein